MFINTKLKSLLEQRGITPNALANELDIAPAAVYKWFKEENPSCPSWENIEKIIDFLGITPLALFSDIQLEELTEEQKQLLDDWNCLDKEERTLILGLIKKFKAIRLETYEKHKRQ